MTRSKLLSDPGTVTLPHRRLDLRRIEVPGEAAVVVEVVLDNCRKQRYE